MELQNAKSIQNLKRAHQRAKSLLMGEKIEEKDFFISKILNFLKKDPIALRRIKNLRPPVRNKYIERLILCSVGKKETDQMGAYEIQQAVLSALFMPLRQNIGSCFATAPAILIQAEQTGRLLDDLIEIIETGILKRTFVGVEHSTPVSPNWSAWSSESPQTDHALLKAWEFTLATFSDYHTEFYKWNLYTSLGLNVKEKNGIGALLYHEIQKKLDESNEKLGKLHDEYEKAYHHTMTSQAFLSRATTYDDARRKKAELNTSAAHMDAIQYMRDETQGASRHYAEFFNFLIKNYSEKFPEYFQEIYDPEVVDRKVAPYDDSPAGFRLVYKHGRSDPSTWTFVSSEKEFIAILSQFFLAVEGDLIALCEWERGKKELPYFTGLIIQHIRSEEFFKWSMKRIKKLHGSTSTPWSYVSGGTMHTLLKCYYRNEGEITEVKKCVDSAQELALFLLELMKDLPYELTSQFEKDPFKSLLMYSPTHAFSLKPGTLFFREGWEDKGFTYSWLRDKVLLPASERFQKILLDRNEQFELAKQLITNKVFKPSKTPMTLASFRKNLLKIAKDPNDVDTLLYKAFPQKPLIFADTNWAHRSFAFVVNPGTCELELWQVEDEWGAPMSVWKPFFSKDVKNAWGVLVRPSEYGGKPLAPNLFWKV